MSLIGKDKFWILNVVWFVVNTLGYLIDPALWRKWEEDKKRELWEMYQ